MGIPERAGMSRPIRTSLLMGLDYPELAETPPKHPHFASLPNISTIRASSLSSVKVGEHRSV